MNHIIGTIVMLCGVILIGWDLYALYHGQAPSLFGFGMGTVCALTGAKWMQGDWCISITKDQS